MTPNSVFTPILLGLLLVKHDLKLDDFEGRLQQDNFRRSTVQNMDNPPSYSVVLNETEQ